MASNSSKPNSHKQPKDIEKSSNDSDSLENGEAEKLTEDLDFWSMDADIEQIDTDIENIEDVDEFLNSPVLPIGKTKTLSEIFDTPAELKELEDDKTFEKLAHANSREEINTARSLSDEDLEEYQNLEKEEHLEIAKQKREKKESTKKLTPMERVGTAICVLFLIGFCVYFYNYYNEHFEVLTDDEWATNIPVEGEYAHIKSIDTWWSEPVSRAKFGVKLVPCLTVTLDDDAKSGTLRIIFFSYEEGLNGNKRAKGDPFLLEFSDGKFANGKKSITIQGTDGFKSLAQFYLYKNQIADRWTVSLKEGPSISISSDDFKDLGHAPIDPILRTLQSSK